MNWKGRYLDLTLVDGILTLSHQRAFAENLSLQVRKIEVNRLIRSRLKRLGPLIRGNAPQNFQIDVIAVSRSSFKSLVIEVEAVLATMATQPFSGRVTEELLGISSQERLRWTKDGRLPHSGTAPIHRGRTIMLPVYAVERVVSLKSAPEVIAAWREADDMFPL